VRQAVKIGVAALATLAAHGAVAASAIPPHLQPANHIEFHDYLDAPDHRAFAVAPGGAYGWSAGQPSEPVAEEKALDDCGAHTDQHCVMFSVDGQVVFDGKAWSRLWGPYATAKQAAAASIGSARGNRLPDLALRDEHGKPVTMTALAGKVVFLHFWGTWCPPCLRELPEVKKLHDALADRRDVAFVLVQARESAEVARDWLHRQALSLPLYDSGSRGESDDQFHLSGGGKIADRQVAARFPTTYVLDKRGMVVFSHVGPLADWLAFEAFLRDTADRSGK
jgi:thiol-disulfide isomerase/thioredoxin